MSDSEQVIIYDRQVVSGPSLRPLPFVMFMCMFVGWVIDHDGELCWYNSRIDCKTVLLYRWSR